MAKPQATGLRPWRSLLWILNSIEPHHRPALNEPNDKILEMFIPE